MMVKSPGHSKQLNNKVDLFLDSGAFSAWSKGLEINIDDYIAYIKKHKKYINIYANLDVIYNGAQSYENWRYMRSKGLDPLPVWHISDKIENDAKYLTAYLDKCDYIALGAISELDSNVKKTSLDDVWLNYLVDSEGYAKYKVHAFGLTTRTLMYRYPWYSVDSTSWVLTGRFGAVFVPKKRMGEYAYDADPWKVSVSNRSPGNVSRPKKYSEQRVGHIPKDQLPSKPGDTEKELGKHITTFKPMEKEQIEEYFESKGFKKGHSEYRQEGKDYKLQKGERWFGKEEADSQRNVKPNRGGKVLRGWTKERTVETVIESGYVNDYKQRDELNIIYFLDWEKSFPDWRKVKLVAKQIKKFGMARR
jgi:hypothetical protein